MKGYQKLIKYIAYALAALIIFSILSLVFGGVGLLGGIFGDNDTLGKLKEVGLSDNYRILDIEVEGVNILIKKGKTLKVETDSEDVRVKEVGDRLLIAEDNDKWFNKKSGKELIIYVPGDYVFDVVNLESGAGRVDVEILKARELELDLGAGRVILDELEIINEASIEGGAGEVVILGGIINNLDLDMGLGRVELNSKLKGVNDINAGIGEVNLNLLDSEDNYRFNVSKGIGNITISDMDMSNDSSYGSGNSIININGGIGSIKVNFDSNTNV